MVEALESLELRNVLETAAQMQLAVRLKLFAILAGLIAISVILFRHSLPAFFTFVLVMIFLGAIPVILIVALIWAPYNRAFSDTVLKKWVEFRLPGATFERGIAPSIIELNHSWLWIARIHSHQSDARITIADSGVSTRCYELRAHENRPIEPVEEEVSRRALDGERETWIETVVTREREIGDGLFAVGDLRSKSLPNTFKMVVVPTDQPYVMDDDCLVITRTGSSVTLKVHKRSWPAELSDKEPLSWDVEFPEAALLPADEVVIMRHAHEKISSIDFAFDSLFSVFTNDEVRARALLSGGIAEELAKIKTRLDSEVLFSIVGNRTHLVCQTKRAFPDIPFFDKIDSAMVKRLDTFANNIRIAVETTRRIARIVDRIVAENEFDPAPTTERPL